MRDTGSTRLIKRSVMLHGHATSVALEPAFWTALARWADEAGMSQAALIAAVDVKRDGGSLASALRLAALDYAFGAEPHTASQ